MKQKKNNCIVTFFIVFSFCASNFVYSQQNVVDRIYTNYNGYWTSGSGTSGSGTSNQNLILPDNTHELIGFRWNGDVFSTGVSDSTLTAESINFIPANFRAFPVKDIPYTDGGSRFFAFGAMVDGLPGDKPGGVDAVNRLPFTKPGKLSFMLTSGKQGLNLGSAVTNIPISSEALTFNITKIENIEKIADDIPDIIVTQMAQPNSVNDTIFFEDINGKVIGKKLTINFNNSLETPVLGSWRIDFFNPVSGEPWEVNTTRAIRLWARKASDFGLTEDNIDNVAALRYKLMGSSDPAFLAFNTELITVMGAIDDEASVSANSASGVDVPVLGNDTYRTIDDISISISSHPSDGNIQINSNKSINYKPYTGFMGEDSFVYKICENGICDSAQVNIKVKNYWLGSTSNDWGDASNWTANMIPPSNKNIEFASIANNEGQAALNDLQLDTSTREINNLTIQTDKKLIIPAQKTLIVNGSINTDNNNRIIIKASEAVANASFFFPNETKPVYATVEMFSKAFIGTELDDNAKYRWQYFGIPLHKITASPTFDSSWIRIWNEAKQTDTTGEQWDFLSNNSVMKAFQGYEITQPAKRSFSISGQLVNRNLTDTLLTVTDISFYQGQHILANPYTMAINVADISFGNGMEKTVYLYNTGSFADWYNGDGKNGSVFNESTTPGQYLSIPKNQANYTGTTSIPSMQGFLVKVDTKNNHKSGTLSIDYALSTKNIVAQRAKSDNSKTYTTIDMRSENYVDRLWLFTEEACSNNFDNGWDGPKILASGEVAQLYASTEDDIYQVCSTNDINGIDIGFKAGSKDVNYTLSFQHSNLSERYNSIFLLDKITNEMIDITANNTEYHFTVSNSSEAQNRFKIISQLNENDQNESGITTYIENQTLYINNRNLEKGMFFIYNISGNMLQQGLFEKNTTTLIPITLSQGVYLIKTICNNKETTNKQFVLQYEK